MSNENVWRAVKKLSEVLRRSDLIREYISALPRNSSTNSSDNPVSEQVSNIFASYSSAESEILLPHKFAHIARQCHFVDLSTPGLRSFFLTASQVSVVTIYIVSWVRSRLPGFPLIPVPDLADGSHLTNLELGYAIPWNDNVVDPRIRYNFSPSTPAAISEIGQDFIVCLRDLTSALQDSTEWRSFQSEFASLTREDEVSLRLARSKVLKCLSASNIDRYDPQYASRRSEYRQNVMENADFQLTDRAFSFRRSFLEVNDLIDQTLVVILGQLTAYGGLDAISPLPGMSRLKDVVSFQSHDFAQIGALVRVDHPLSPGALLINSVSFNYSSTGQEKLLYEGTIIPGSDASEV